MNANSATDGLSIDIWNEPDLTIFWNRGQTQYLQMWGRTYHRLRYDSGSNCALFENKHTVYLLTFFLLRSEWPNVKLLGPTFAGEPDASNSCEWPSVYIGHN